MSHSFSNALISEIFAEIAAALKVQNDDRFRIRAYDAAVSVFSQLPDTIEKYWREGTLTTIPGIGKIFAGKIDELFTTGEINEFIDIKSSLPAGMFVLLKVEGVGPKKAFRLSQEFELVDGDITIKKLISHAKKGEVSALDGFGKKSEEQLLENLTIFSQKGEKQRILLYEADKVVAKILSQIENEPEIEKISPLGSLRRRKETVGDIDIGIATQKPEAVSAVLQDLSGVSKVISAGKGLVRVMWEGDVHVDFKIVDPGEWGSLLQHFTGSKEHNVSLREMAIKKDMSMSEHGMKIDGKWHRYTTEEGFYRALGVDWIPPVLREGGEEIVRSQNLPKLIQVKDIRGDLHTHTNYGWVNSHDAGMSSVDELADAAIELDYEYLGIGDHNPSTSTYSQEDQIKQIQRRSEHIEQINSSYENRVKKRTIKLYKTLEVDIKPDGNLAIPEESIQFLDYVIVSIHSSFKKPVEEQTERILKALSFPKVKILAHPTGRLINKRESIKADWDKIFDFCKEKRIALEINAAPQRLDLSDKMVKKAIKNGNLLCINTDAHSHHGLAGMYFGVDVARRGWAIKEQIINSWTLEKFNSWIRHK